MDGLRNDDGFVYLRHLVPGAILMAMLTGIVMLIAIGIFGAENTLIWLLRGVAAVIPVVSYGLSFMIACRGGGEYSGYQWIAGTATFLLLGILSTLLNLAHYGLI